MKAFLFFLTHVIAGNSYKDQKVLQCQVKNKGFVSKLTGLDIWSVDILKKTVVVRVLNNQQEQLARQDGNCTELISDLASLEEPIRPLLRSTNLEPTSEFFKDYRSYDEMKRALEKWSKYSPYATFIKSIGKSVQKRDIFAIKITGKSQSKAKKRGLFFNGGLHAREWVGPAASLYIIKKLLDDAEKPQIKSLLDNFEFHFTPLSNPDGYEFSRTPGNRLWRKNRSRNGDGTYGVDLNRNWDDHWGLVGGSTDTDAEIYQGPRVQSEPETKVLASYIKGIPNRYGGIDFHSYGQYILHNWGWTTQLSANDKLLRPLGLAMKAAFKRKGFEYTTQTSAELYPASGALDDWMGSKAQLISFTIELCPSPSSKNGFNLPKNNIIPCADGAYEAVIAYAEYLRNNYIPPNIPIP